MWVFLSRFLLMTHPLGSTLLPVLLLCLVLLLRFLALLLSFLLLVIILFIYFFWFLFWFISLFVCVCFSSGLLFHFEIFVGRILVSVDLHVGHDLLLLHDGVMCGHVLQVRKSLIFVSQKWKRGRYMHVHTERFHFRSEHDRKASKSQHYR